MYIQQTDGKNQLLDPAMHMCVSALQGIIIVGCTGEACRLKCVPNLCVCKI